MEPDNDDGLGPDFSAEATEVKTPALELDAALEGDRGWTANRVRSLLQAKGILVHGALAVDRGRSQEWIYTEADLSAIAPALSRILNRYPATRAAAAGGDELAVAIGFGGYAFRSISERRAYLRLVEHVEQTADVEPVTPAATEAAAAMATAADLADPTDLEWPAEGEPPPITGRR